MQGKYAKDSCLKGLLARIRITVKCDNINDKIKVSFVSLLSNILQFLFIIICFIFVSFFEKLKLFHHSLTINNENIYNFTLNLSIY